VLLILILGIIGGAGYVHFTDPDRPLHRIEQALRQGQKVVLIGESGKPVWSRWQSPEARVLKGVQGPGQAFTLECSSLGTLELLPDPQCAAYRLSAEIDLRDPNFGKAQAGIYFAWVGQKNLVYLSTLGFNDRQGAAGDVAEFALRTSSDLTNWQTHGIAYHDLQPIRPREDRWRKLAADVTLRSIRLFADEELVADVSRDAFLTHATRFFKLPQVPRGDPQFQARGALGIYLLLGEAAFRRVAVEPINDGT
jgi:hypothetical protein